MTAESFFLVINGIAGIGWLMILVGSRFWQAADQFVVGVVVTLLALIYTYLNFGHIGEVGGATSFLTFEGVTKVFSNPYLIDAGWAHLLALDLLMGIWIKNSAAKNGFPYWLVVIVLLITIMFTPLGFLIYQLIRWYKTKQYFDTSIPN
jgi:Domain of unknown function (DUF4281)